MTCIFSFFFPYFCQYNMSNSLLRVMKIISLIIWHWIFFFPKDLASLCLGISYGSFLTQSLQVFRCGAVNASRTPMSKSAGKARLSERKQNWGVQALSFKKVSQARAVWLVPNKFHNNFITHLIQETCEWLLLSYKTTTPWFFPITCKRKPVHF